MVTSSQESEPLVDSDTSPTTPEDDQPRVDPDWPLDPPEDPEEVDRDRPLDPPGGPTLNQPTDTPAIKSATCQTLAQLASNSS